MTVELKTKIEQSIRRFATGNLTRNSLNLFETLGYVTERRASLKEPTFDEFRETYIEDQPFHETRARVSEWQYVDLLFQLSKEEVLKQTSLFDSKKVDNTIIETYLFFVIELNNRPYYRTELSQITREINKLFPMPVMILFKYGNLLTLSVINRRLHKRDETKDVLEKVTLIKDINAKDPHRAHVEILFDLSFDKLNEKHQVTNFVELHNAWQKTLDTKELNKRFFNELANWYFWATSQVVFPDDEIKDKDIRNATGIIRLITRLIFIWFLKEKNLVSDDLFDEKRLKKILNYSDKNQSAYYKAILQNLFFATLNTEMGTRRFRSKQDGGRNGHYFIHNVLRNENQFINARESLEKYFDPVPFLNGGLFECLDKQVEKNGKLVNIRIDGFSDRPDNILTVPDELFFSEKEKVIDLSQVYGTPRKSKEKVRGLITILNSYKFTITENTPVEEEVALDPELLGKVFENLLANYNPETQTTARKQTGSFYTPREIVNYMVDESLLAYLKQQLNDDESTEAKLRDLLSYSENPNPFHRNDTTALIRAIDSIKILDPACGSGAFPMGVLHKLVHVLHKIDPRNEQWEKRQLEKVDNLIGEAGSITDTRTREKVIADLEETRKGVVEAFENNELDYGRKLFLIENCIFGVDIQPIAVQIAKLRFFISLIVDQKTNREKENLGIRPLPNLETKFVAANTLIALDKEEANLFTNPEIEKKKDQLKKVRHDYFEARTPKRKANCREKDKQLRDELSQILMKEHFLQPEEAKKLAAWDPYDQNSSAPFFDIEWMFGFVEGFDIVIGNPPYIDSETMIKDDPEFRTYLKRKYISTKGNWDLFVVFVEKAMKLTKNNGCLSFIIPNKLISAKYTYELRNYLNSKSIIELVDYSNVDVFKESDVYPIVLVASNNENRIQKVRTKVMCSLVDVKTINNISPKDFYSDIFWDKYFFDKSILKVINQLSANKDQLNKYFPDIVGAATVNEAYLIKNYLEELSSQNIFLKFINTGTIDPYYSLWGIKKTHYIKSSFNRPVILSSNLKRISNTRYKQSLSSKIIIAGMALGIEAYYDFGEYCAGKSTSIILGEPSSLKTLTGILNSKLISFWFSKYFNSLSMAGGYFNIGNNEIEMIPIPSKIKFPILPIAKTVNYILQSTRTRNGISFFIRLIDAMVYELYLNEAIQLANCEVLKHLGNLPELKKDWDDEKKLQVIDKVYRELSDPGHPVSVAMFKMDTIEEIRIIEGKK